MLYGFNARVGAVEDGLEHAMLCAAEATFLMASGGCEAWGGERGCLAVSWDGGDRVCTREGRCAVCGRVSRVALWRMFILVAGELGMVCACGLGAGKVRALDRGWRWTMGCLLYKVGTASS